MAIRLDPFRRPHVERWLECWNAVNAASLAERGLMELHAPALTTHAELSSQPLLLMMLALYDADQNGLQRLDGRLGRTELYERLLQRFAEREVAKSGRSLPGEEFEHAVDRELLRLSIVAFAMFNRRQQWATEEELDRDLSVLLPPSAARVAELSGMRSPLTPSERAVGRFFFVHQSRATRDGRELRTFEFLHATFGEYLIGRLVARELMDMASVVRLNRGRSREVSIDDAFLHAVLSFAPLTMRGAAVSFLRELIGRWDPEDRRLLREPVLRLLRSAMDPVQDHSYDLYQPVELGVPARHGTYACNMFVLLLLIGGEVRASEIFDGKPHPFLHWRNLMHLWRSQITIEGWVGLLQLVSGERTKSGTARDVRLYLADRKVPTPRLDPTWLYNDLSSVRDAAGAMGWMFHQHEEMRHHVNLVCERRSDLFAHVADPFVDHLPEALTAFARDRDGTARSAANSLVAVMLAGAEEDSREVQRLYDYCLGVAEHAFPDGASELRSVYLKVVLRQFTLDEARMDLSWRAAFLGRVQQLSPAVATIDVTAVPNGEERQPHPDPRLA